MSRYTGPRVRVMRALGCDLPGFSRKKIDRRPYPPGQHGQARHKLSEYKLRLIEKQKLRFGYGVSEVQLRRLMVEAGRSQGAPGDKLVELLERRLDNVVFRAGFARTIPAARQLVCHGFVHVNGRRVDIASFRVDQGHTISLVPRVWKNPHVLSSVADETMERASWLNVDKAAFSATVTALPDASSALFPVDVQRVVEFYSLRL
ncbi:30S ribosomal protein S4 [Polyangium jinanense]|uniref:Small ribosomal subunit protein uS4 n=1 Tax=Polyangium jinanense TaxID=2829994 RepID=A0A9X3X7L0_9BACT|nr:30S ribosomal protein S4 [Polyangium jinanense]MDC3961323.1 30S ribosomal protein S4 [Polyangium jinanense]MDC3984045.1 30S ribosomal protein S4 [Polyangium jinanense]